MNDDTIAKILSYKQSMAEKEAMIKQNEKEYRFAINKMANDDNGRFVLHYMYRFSMIHDIVSDNLVEVNVYRNLNLLLVRKYLTLENIRRVEEYGRK
jgi:hypothetical protein